MKISAFFQVAALCGSSVFVLGGCHSKTPPASSAEQSPTPSGANGGFVSQAQARQDRMRTELGLTDDQMQKIHAIMEDGHSAREALRSDQSLTEEQRNAKIQAMRQEFETKIEAILTPDQIAKFQEMRQRREGGGGNGGGGNRQGGGGGGGNWQNRGTNSQQSPAVQSSPGQQQ